MSDIDSEVNNRVADSQQGYLEKDDSDDREEGDDDIPESGITGIPISLCLLPAQVLINTPFQVAITMGVTTATGGTAQGGVLLNFTDCIGGFIGTNPVFVPLDGSSNVVVVPVLGGVSTPGAVVVIARPATLPQGAAHAIPDPNTRKFLTANLTILS